MRVFERSHERCELTLTEDQLRTRRYAHDVLVEDTVVEHRSALHAKWECDRACARYLAEGFVRAAGTDDLRLSRAELEDALCAAPDDLDTYLVYADWLSERGDPWGELIAVQHAIQGLPRFSPAARRAELARAETELMFRHAGRLWAALGETIVNEDTQTYACDGIDVTWQCGFVRGARIGCAHDVELFATQIAGLAELDIALVLRSLVLRDSTWKPGSLEAVAARRWRSLEELVVDGVEEPFDARRLVPLLATDAAPRLARVQLEGTTHTDAVCEAIARGPIAARIESLCLDGGELTQAGIAALASTTFPALAELVLGGTGIPSEARGRLEGVARRVLLRPRPDHR